MLEPVGIAFGLPESRLVLPLDEITALIGANDAGKTTLLHTVQSVFAAVAGNDANHVRVPDVFLALRGDRRLIATLADSSNPVPDTALRVIESLTELEQVDVVVRSGARLTTWLAAPAGFVAGVDELAELVAAAGVDLASYPDWMPVPVTQLFENVPESLRLMIPIALQLPLPEEELLHHVNLAVERLLKAFTNVRKCGAGGKLASLGVEALPDGEVVQLREWGESTSSDPWLYPSFASGGVHEVVHPDLHTATWALSALISRALPEFISDGYRCQVQPSALSTWIRGGERTLLLMRKHQSERAFPSNLLAEGFKLWLQLSVLDAVTDIHMLANWIDEAFSSGQQSIGGVDSQSWLEDIQPAVSALTDLGVLGSASGNRFNRQALQVLSDACSPLVQSQGLDDLGRASVSVAILDEPERQLHPRLQRVATSWLVSRAESRSARYVLATHSVAFMGLAPSASFFHVRRDWSGSPEVIPIDPQALTATDVVADELGLDRGELLAFVQQVVFVEGITDKLFLEELYGKELRQVGAVVIALGGAKKTPSVIPMTELLMRFTTRPAKVILDDVPASKFERLKVDAAYRKEAIGDRQIELRELARLVQSAIELERDLVGLAISTKDIFDLVDEGVVADCLALPGKEPFPGHHLARERVGERKWKDVYLKSYGINILDPETFVRAGVEMRRRGLVVPELGRLLGLAELP